MNLPAVEGMDRLLGPRAPRIVVINQADERVPAREILAGLLAANASINPKYFYDPHGCALFSAICTTPEYYLTRTEAMIFEGHRAQIRACLPASIQWVDLGCGGGDKSARWLEATAARRFIGVDIARDWLVHAVRTTAARFPGVECIGVVADFAQSLAIQDVIDERPELSPVFFYPGSSLGNFTHPGALRLLKSVRDHLGAGGSLLVGVDLVKDQRVLEDAYNDGQGLTAAFNRNVLQVANRLLGSDFDPERFDHCATYNQDENRVEMRLRSNCPQRVRLGEDARDFEAGHCILTEYCHKYTLDGFARLLTLAGFTQQRVWTDPAAWFAVFLATP